ncbi:MAG: trypsin-like peptidase domain-containing protein [Pirellulales bacterium]|nr:trypsin-like peptidase domain-containing protein [Pirellulales bacterium]
MKRLRLFDVVFLLMSLMFACTVAGASVQECIDATCRITTPLDARGECGVGSGCVFLKAGGGVYVLTAAHVVEGTNRCSCEFWHSGHLSRPIEASVTQRDPRNDTAILALRESDFQGYPPLAIPIAPHGLGVRPGDQIISVGCANGSWSTAWSGHCLGFVKDRIAFMPAPAQGRSGSALFDAGGQYIVGMVNARTADGTMEGRGAYYGLRATALHDAALVPIPDPLTNAVPVQCPDGACPAPTPRSRQYVLPYRNRQEAEKQPPAVNIYPTLPAPTPPAPLSAEYGSYDSEPADNELSQLGVVAAFIAAVFAGIMLFYVAGKN